MTDRLRHSELDWLPVPAALLDRAGAVIALNPPLQRLLDGAPLALERIWQALLAALDSGTGFAKDIELAKVAVRVTAALRGDHVLAIFNELSPRAAVASGPQRLESLGMVAGDLAHEFNNQLVGVIADASMLREEDELGDAGRESVVRIEAAARRMSQLSRQLLAFAGRGRFVTMLLDPDTLLVESRDRFERLVRPGATLSLEVAGGGAIAIEADRGLLRQVITDLVENASEALPADGGEIRVTSRTVVISGSPHWELEVRDNGRGIEPTTLSRIFDPFFSTKAEHRGLGLSAALGIVRRLGGDLECVSRVEHGAAFRVRLPIVPGAVVPRRRTTSQQPPLEKLTGLRILVADDEPTVRATVRRMLERRGAVPTLAADGGEAERLLRSEQFDVVLLDVMMPNRTGYELVPIVRELHPSVPVILMSGFTDQAQGVEPPDTFLEKPFNASMLEAAIQAALRG